MAQRCAKCGEKPDGLPDKRCPKGGWHEYRAETAFEILGMTAEPDPEAASFAHYRRHLLMANSAVPVVYGLDALEGSQDWTHVCFPF